jgi:hypothetical protein
MFLEHKVDEATTDKIHYLPVTTSEGIQDDGTETENNSYTTNKYIESPVTASEDNESKTIDPEETDASHNHDLPIVTAPATVPAIIEQDITESSYPVKVPTNAPQTFTTDNVNIEITSRPEETFTVPTIVVGDNEPKTTDPTYRCSTNIYHR